MIELKLKVEKKNIIVIIIMKEKNIILILIIEKILKDQMKKIKVKKEKDII